MTVITHRPLTTNELFQRNNKEIADNMVSRIKKAKPFPFDPKLSSNNDVYLKPIPSYLMDWGFVMSIPKSL